MINFFSKNKFIFYLSNLILIFLYLFPGSVLGWFLYNDLNSQPQITPDFIISTNHLYAFLIISTLGLLTFNLSNQFIYISIYLIFLSLALEVAHYFIPKRSFEFSDLFGNIIGVLIVFLYDQINQYFLNSKNEK